MSVFTLVSAMIQASPDNAVVVQKSQTLKKVTREAGEGAHSVSQLSQEIVKTSDFKSGLPSALDVLQSGDVSIAVVDRYGMMSSGKAGLQARGHIEAKHLAMTNEIKQDDQKMQQAATDYKAKMSMLSESAREKEEKQLMKMERDLKAKIQDKEEELKIEMQIVTERLMREMDESIIAMAQAQGIALVFDKTGQVVYVAPALDKTSEALASMDQMYEIKLAQEKEKSKSEAAHVVA